MVARSCVGDRWGQITADLIRLKIAKIPQVKSPRGLTKPKAKNLLTDEVLDFDNQCCKVRLTEAYCQPYPD